MNCDTWPVPDAGACVGGCTIPVGVDPDLLEAASVQAGIILRRLSGNQIGQCADTLRPLSECGCRYRCYCSGDRIRLLSPAGPVTGIETITVDGDTVEDTGYRFYPSSQLLYRVPPDVWPHRDDRTADCDTVGSFCVDVLIGAEPDAWALAVHAELTCELIAACVGGKCRLPKNATSVNAQGISIQLSADDVKQFIPAVSAWVAAVNPAGATQPPVVYSPELGGY